MESDFPWPVVHLRYGRELVTLEANLGMLKFGLPSAVDLVNVLTKNSVDSMG